jgi:hypothetical protein
VLEQVLLLLHEHVQQQIGVKMEIQKMLTKILLEEKGGGVLLVRNVERFLNQGNIGVTLINGRIHSKFLFIIQWQQRKDIVGFSPCITPKKRV